MLVPGSSKDVVLLLPLFAAVMLSPGDPGFGLELPL